MSLFEELRRRNVFRVAIAYVVATWLILQVADVVLNNFGAPAWVFKSLVFIIIAGFPLALIFAWAFELTPEGLKKERDVDRSRSIARKTGQRLDRMIIGILALGIVYLATDRFLLHPPAPESAVAAMSDGSSSDGRGDHTAAVSSTPSIAVLPFVNMSPDPDQEFFSEGIAEELLNVLAQYKDLRVAARTSSFQFKGHNEDIGKIAEVLHVNHVVEGSVRKSGSRLRITAQLIRADTGFHMWSETYDRELDDVFAIQDEIAKAISDALKVQLALGDESERPGVIAAANTAAYEAFLRGRGLLHQRGRGPIEEGVSELEKSLRLDANYGPAHAQLAIGYLLLLNSQQTYGDLTLAESQRRALPHLQRALELSPNLAEAYAGYALMSLDNGDTEQAIQYANKALELNPSYVDALNWLSIAYQNRGELAAGSQILDKIAEVDPLSVIGRMNISARTVVRQQPELAHRQAEDLIAQNPWAGYAAHALASVSTGEIAESLDWSLRAYARNPTDNLSNYNLVLGLAAVGLDDEARRITNDLLPEVEGMAGNHDTAVELAQRRAELDPQNIDVLRWSAYALYAARRFPEARQAYERIELLIPAGDLIGTDHDLINYAVALRETGDSVAAEAKFETAEQIFKRMRDVGYDDYTTHLAEARLHAWLGESDAAVQALQISFERGLRSLWMLDNDILFDGVRKDQRIADWLQRVSSALAIERQKSLQLICLDNPVPEAWQPLPGTCENVQLRTST
jgi:TolB-like protein/Flp pilus assembly protein TadD